MLKFGRMGEAQIDEQGRPDPPQEAGEMATLLGFLDYQRATLEWKCRGLSDDQLRAPHPPSSITLGGLLKHLAYVEDYWFTEVAGGEATPEPWASADTEADPDWEWHSAVDDAASDLRALWPSESSAPTLSWPPGSARVRTAALNETHAAWGGAGHVSLRWVLVHMIEEYARHNGQADLIRESIDGETGE